MTSCASPEPAAAGRREAPHTPRRRSSDTRASSSAAVPHSMIQSPTSANQPASATSSSAAASRRAVAASNFRSACRHNSARSSARPCAIPCSQPCAIPCSRPSSTHSSVHSLCEQQLRQVRTVLPGDSRDDGAFRHLPLQAYNLPGPQREGRPDHARPKARRLQQAQAMAPRKLDVHARRRRELNAAVNVARRAGADPVAAGPANGAAGQRLPAGGDGSERDHVRPARAEDETGTRTDA